MTATAATRRSRALEAIRKANAPLPPEDSVSFRAVTTAAVICGVLACESVGELGPTTALLASLAVVVGMVFSHRTRRRPFPGVKWVLALTVCAVFAVFVSQVLSEARAGDLGSVEVPLATLFVWIQATHAFDVPARRDLLFSVAASAAFVAVASAQAIETSFLAIVGLWLAVSVIALVLSWRSMSGGGGRVPLGTIAGCVAVTGLIAAVIVTVLPPPSPSRLITLPQSITDRLALPQGGGLAGGSTGAQPVRPASPGGPLGVGGFVGFADNLDTALRGSLDNEVVMRVRASRPGYFQALTYDQWNGRSWTNVGVAHGLVQLPGPSPFNVPADTRSGARMLAVPLPPSGAQDVQTFYVAQPLTNVLVAAADAVQVWLPSKSLYRDYTDDSIRSPVAITPGTVYTVVSDLTQQPPSVLAGDVAAPAEFVATDPAGRQDLELPHAYPAVFALARSITRSDRTVYAKIAALEGWMRTHVRYSLDIPPLLAGQDAVQQFLFHGRVGFCEQISTALTVMLRTLGIPAREVTGFVPGSFNPLTDLYEIQARDAHAWVEVDFPGYGWQSFDPTADVPLANPSPGLLIASDVWRLLRSAPWAPIGGAAAALVALAAGLRWLRRRPRTWPERVARALERAGAGAGVRRGGGETLEEYGRRLLEATAPASPPAAAILSGIATVESAAYEGPAPDERARREAEESVRELGRAVRRRRGGRGPGHSTRRLEDRHQLHVLGHREEVEAP